MDIEKEAARITKRINEQIAAACAEQHPLAWDHVAEGVVDQNLDTDRWDYQMLRYLGNAPPEVVLTRYRPPEFDPVPDRELPVDW